MGPVHMGCVAVTCMEAFANVPPRDDVSVSSSVRAFRMAGAVAPVGQVFAAFMSVLIGNVMNLCAQCLWM